MPKTTVAQLETRVEELESLVGQLLTIDAYQGRTLGEVLRALKDAPKPTAGRRHTNSRTPVPCEVPNCPGHTLQATVTKHVAAVAAKAAKSQS